MALQFKIFYLEYGVRHGDHLFITEAIREWLLQQYPSMENCLFKHDRMVVNHCYATEDGPLCLLLSMKAQVIGAVPAQLVRKALLKYRR